MEGWVDFQAGLWKHLALCFRAAAAVSRKINIPLFHSSVMASFSSFAGCLSLCSQHWCTCNILHRFVKVSIQIHYLILFLVFKKKEKQTRPFTLVDLFIMQPTLTKTSWVWKTVGGRLGCSVLIFWMGRKALRRPLWFCWHGRERPMGQVFLLGSLFLFLIVSWWSVCTEDVKKFRGLWWKFATCGRVTVSHSWESETSLG